MESESHYNPFGLIQLDNGSKPNSSKMMSDSEFEMDDQSGKRSYSDSDLRLRESHHSNNSTLMTSFLLLNAMIGSGILNQPQVFMNAGIVAGLIMFLIASVFIWLGIVCLVESGVKSKIYDYSELAHFYFGELGEKIVDISIVIGNFGALLSYCDIIGITASDLILSWGCTDINACGPYMITCLIFLILVFPVCLKKNFGELAIYSVFSMGAIVLIMALVIIAGPIVKNNGPIKAFGRNFGSQLGSIIFTLSCAFATFPTYKSLGERTSAKWQSVTGITVSVGFVMCSIMGIGMTHCCC